MIEVIEYVRRSVYILSDDKEIFDDEETIIGVGE